MSDGDKRIIIDEDWKSQVAREKREASEKAQTPETAEKTLTPEEEVEQNPFLSLVSGLAAQAMFALGLIDEPGSQEVYVDLNQARDAIDTLIVLREKTQGNLTELEKTRLDEATAELERVYVMRAQQIQQANLENPGVNLNKGGTPL